VNFEFRPDEIVVLPDYRNQKFFHVAIAFSAILHSAMFLTSPYWQSPSTSRVDTVQVDIVEMPEDNEQSEPLRNPRSGFVAYAPIGSLTTGEALVTTGGGGRTVQCGICHGPDLKGLGAVPGIAGRSPSYLVRQMYDIQAGTRRGPGTALMKAVVEKLTNDDYVAIAAYVSSRN